MRANPDSDGFILGLTAVLVPDYEVRSTRESGLWPL